MAGDSFDVAAMREAADELATKLQSTEQAAPLNAEDSIAAVKAMGWTDRKAYDYEQYTNDREKRVAEADAMDAAEATEIRERQDPQWLSNAARYEWDDEFGEVGPPIEKLEEMLFRNTHRAEKGDGLSVYDTFKVTVEGPHKIQPVRTFSDAGLHPIMMENVQKCGYDTPTPVQSYCIPAVLLGNDVVACAQTGSGKTAAYLVPILSRLMGKARKLAAPRPDHKDFTADKGVRAEPLVLVVCPSRELACQIFDEARRLCYRTQLRPCVLYGGVPTGVQRLELARGCDILIASPGRLIDFMDKPGILSLNRLKYTIIDEADELLQADWEEEMTKIMGGADANEDADHVYMMFSATFPPQARKLAKEYMADDYVRIRVGRSGSTHSNIQQALIYVDDDRKREALWDLLLSMPPSRTLIFVNSRRMADMLDDFLYNKGLPSTSMHADRTQKEREDAIRAFRMGETPIMVATGVSARGLDIKNVMHVINYDLPSAMHGGIQEYIHRIGRTARIGNLGLASSFYNERNEDIADDLCKILIEAKQVIPDFLAGRVDEKEPIVWEDDSDAEEFAMPDMGNGDAPADDDAADSGFVPDSGFNADAGAEEFSGGNDEFDGGNDGANDAGAW